jgi:NAD(P)H-dependent flavin oxidoreductase YrpB (nitropropane dioxygenase family)
VVAVRTTVAEMFDIEFPIFAFSHCRDIVAAVSKAGGFGVLGAVGHSAELLDTELIDATERLDRLLEAR